MRYATLVTVVLVLSGCAGQGEIPAPSASLETPAGPPDGVGVGDGIEALQAYGAEHVDQFGGLYIDPPGGSHVVMLFTDDLELHAAAVEAIKPGTTLRQVVHTEAELIAVLEGFDFEALKAEGIEMVGGGVDVIGNRVTLEAKSNDPTAELRLELAHGGLLDVTIFPVPGAWQNVAEGDGWRLIADGEAAGTEAYVVRAATDAAEYAEMWEAIGLDGEAPEVDLASEVVVSFGHGIGSSCPEVRLDDVVIQGNIVFSVTSDPLTPRACTADLVGAAMFVVAIARDAVEGGFTLWLNEQAAEQGNAGFSAPVEVELPD
jgi:hypothetical protein